jgi:hypothetical protein
MIETHYLQLNGAPAARTPDRVSSSADGVPVVLGGEVAGSGGGGERADGAMFPTRVRTSAFRRCGQILQAALQPALRG